MEGEEIEVGFNDQLRRNSLRSYPFSSTEGIVLKSAGGGATALNPPRIRLTTGSVSGGLCNFRALFLEDNISDLALGDFWYKYVYHVRGRIGPFPQAPAGADATTACAGIGIGHPYDDFATPQILRPPWPDPSPVTYCCLQYMRKTDTFELWSTPGNGVTPTAKVSVPYVGAVPLNNASKLCELVYDPVNRAVYAIVGGVEIARISDTTKLPRFDSEGVVYQDYITMANIFVESGSLNGTQHEAFFSNFLCWHEDMDTDGVPMW
jgi:hypothetical protein